MLRNMQARVFALLSTMLFLPAAAAGEFSVGAGVGSSNIQGSRTPDAGVPIFVPGQRLDQNDTAFELFAAYRLNRYFSIETGYQDFGNAGKTFVINPDLVFIQAPQDRQDVDITALSLGVVIEYPLADAFSVFALGGVARHDVDVRWSLSFAGDQALPPPFRVSDNDTSGYYGAGIRYQFAEPWSLRLTWRGESVDGAGSDFDLSTFSAAVAFHF